MSEYLKQLATIIHEHGFESVLETPEHEVDTPHHFIQTPRLRWGPLTLWKGRRVAEITSEAYGGAQMTEAVPDPVEVSLFYQGLTIHVLSGKFRPELQKLSEHLRCSLREPVTID
jgi:hypothetical protein